MKVEIWSDVVCPWCYIGKRRFEAALARFAHRDEVDLVWRSFELDASAGPSPAEPGTYATRLAAKYGRSVEQAQQMMRRDDGERRRGGARLPLRPRPARQHVRRPPAAAPRPRARPAGRAQGAAGPRHVHRGLAEQRPGGAAGAGPRGRAARRRGRRRAGLRPLRRRGAGRRGAGPGVRHQRRAVLRRRREVRHLRRAAGRPGAAGARDRLGGAVAAHAGRAAARRAPAARATPAPSE